MHRLAFILSIAATACVADSGDEGFNIVHNLVPGAGCSITPSNMFVPSGTIEADSVNPYLLTPEIQSRIQSVEGGSDAQRTIALRGARVAVSVASGNATITNGSFTSLFAASLEPMGTTAVAFDIVTPAIIAQVAGSVTATERVQLVAKITPFGALGGSGDEIDGVPFEYPVTVCRGCIRVNLGACPLPMGTTVEDASNPCNPYQDGRIGCCTDATTNQLVCPATVATM